MPLQPHGPHASWFAETEVFLLHEIVTRFDLLARSRVLDARGITYPEFLVALAVREHGEPTQGDVGEVANMSKSLVSQRVAALVAKGIVVQKRDAGNRRQVRLDLTPEGRAMLDAIYGELAAAAEQIFDVLGAQRPGFLDALKRLRAALIAAEAEDAGS